MIENVLYPNLKLKLVKSKSFGWCQPKNGYSYASLVVNVIIKSIKEDAGFGKRGHLGRWGAIHEIDVTRVGPLKVICPCSSIGRKLIH